MALPATMSTDDDASGLPPSYSHATEDNNDDVVPPVILVLAGQSIHAESADSAPLYQVNRGIASLSHATAEVAFSRVERTVKANGDGEPSVKVRQQEIYTLKDLDDSTGVVKLPSSSPCFYIRAVSKRRALGNVGLKKEKHMFQDPRWLALPIDVSGKKSEYGLPIFIKDSKALFEVRQKSGRWEWTDADGNAVAVEDEADDQYRLIVTTSLHRETMDALVALWCCRIWQHSAETIEKVHEGMEGVKRRLRLAVEIKIPQGGRSRHAF